MYNQCTVHIQHRGGILLRVLGIGDNVVDKYTYKRVMYPGGNALNFSVYAQMLGESAAYLGIFGTDDEAFHIKAVLQELEIDTSRCKEIKGESGYALVGLENGDRVFLESNEGGIRQYHKLQLEEEDMKYIQSFDLLHTSKYSYMEEAMPKLRAAGVPISFDFSDDFTEEYLSEIGPNVDFSFLSCSHLSLSEAKNTLKKMISLGNKLAVATMGADGALLYDGNSFYKQKPRLIEAVDTLGAGDSFLTAFLVHLLQYEQEGIEAALAKGAEFAASSCLVEGAFGYGKAY